MAGTPLHPEALEAMLPLLKENYGNPQSLHEFGELAKSVMEEARAKVAALINSKPEEVFFTSNGTESNNIALKGLALAHQKKGKHIIISAIEHHSVLYSARSLEKSGFKITLLPVDKYGFVNPATLLENITPETILVSIMYANGEVGTIQPVDEIAKITREKGIIFHTDAVAAAGNIPVDVQKSGIDALSLAGNQFYGPKGAAALYLKKGIRMLPLMEGGIQEESRRPGTENVPAIAGLGKACELAIKEMAVRSENSRKLRDKLIKELTLKIERIYLTGDASGRLPHNASFCVEFIEGEGMLLNLSMEGIAVSSGSACTSRALKASHVLTAMGIDSALAQGSILFGLGASNTEEDIDRVVSVFPPIIEKLRKMSPLYTKYLKTK